MAGSSGYGSPASASGIAVAFPEVTIHLPATVARPVRTIRRHHDATVSEVRRGHGGGLPSGRHAARLPAKHVGAGPAGTILLDDPQPEGPDPPCRCRPTVLA